MAKSKTHKTPSVNVAARYVELIERDGVTPAFVNPDHVAYVMRGVPEGEHPITILGTVGGQQIYVTGELTDIRNKLEAERP